MIAGTFLRCTADDVNSGRNVGPLPDDLLQTLEDVLREVDVDLDEPIEGDVCIWNGSPPQ